MHFCDILIDLYDWYTFFKSLSACKFYPVGENRRFERVAENLPVGKYFVVSLRDAESDAESASLINSIVMIINLFLLLTLFFFDDQCRQ